MEKIYHIEQYLIESIASKKGYLEVNNFLRADTSKVLSASKSLRKKIFEIYFTSRLDGAKIFYMLRTYHALDNTGKVNH